MVDKPLSEQPVIPAKAGIHGAASANGEMDSGLCRSDEVRMLQEMLTPLSWEERLQALETIEGLSIEQVAFSTSFSHEDQMILHALATQKLNHIHAFTLDTGRHFEETHTVFQKTRERYPDFHVEAYYPEAFQLRELIRKQGINGFYDSVEQRKACCYQRKVEPLKRALDGMQVWISGLRQAQSSNRSNIPVAEMDDALGIIKLYPIYDVDDATMRSYIKEHNVPYNELHDKGFPSIGCAPCTRAVQEGDDPRSGRWWWEQDDAQECGLHIVDGKLVRIKQDA